MLPSGQKKKNYLCECTICKNIRLVNAYKVVHNNYKHCNECKPKQLPAVTDIIGKRFGFLVVLNREDNYIQPNGESKVRYRCLCDCGNTIVVMASHLSSGHTQSCGCMRVETLRRMLVKDLKNQKFGKLTVIEKDEIKDGRQFWKCKCDCGKFTVASATSLLCQGKKSCGCIRSIAEYELSVFLDQNGIHYEQQYKFQDCKYKRTLPFDFCIKDQHGEIIMLIELHGQQHYYPFTYCEESELKMIKNYYDRIRKDKIKEEYCQENNIPLLIIKFDKFSCKEKIFMEFYRKIKDG